MISYEDSRATKHLLLDDNYPDRATITTFSQLVPGCWIKFG